MNADFELAEDGTITPAGRGGARMEAGRKPAGYVKPAEAVKFDVARARKETALADMHELDYKIKSQEYVSRASVRQASATVIATIAQTMRSLSDNLERRGVPPEVCAKVDEAVNETLAEAARDLELMSGPG